MPTEGGHRSGSAMWDGRSLLRDGDDHFPDLGTFGPRDSDRSLLRQSRLHPPYLFGDVDHQVVKYPDRRFGHHCPLLDQWFSSR